MLNSLVLRTYRSILWVILKYMMVIDATVLPVILLLGEATLCKPSMQAINDSHYLSKSSLSSKTLHNLSRAKG